MLSSELFSLLDPPTSSFNPVDPLHPVILSSLPTKLAYTNSPIDRIPIGSRLVNGSPYRTPIVFPQ